MKFKYNLKKKLSKNLSSIIRKINWIYIFALNLDFESFFHSLFILVGIKPLSKNRILNIKNKKYFIRGGTTDYFYVYENWESETLKLIKNLKPDIFINIGACIGEWPIKLKNIDMTFHLFEPSTSSLNSAKINSLLNKVDVNFYSVSLGNANKNTTLLETDFNKGSSFITENQKNSRGLKKSSVKMEKLDKYQKKIFSNLDKRYLILIDAEGYEAEILKGASKILESNIDLNIIAECRSEDHLKNLLKILSGFKYKRICKDNIYFFR